MLHVGQMGDERRKGGRGSQSSPAVGATVARMCALSATCLTARRFLL